MEGIARPASINITSALEQLDVAVWARKTVRECVSIAARGSKHRSKVSVDVARVDAVLALLMRHLEDERRVLAERGTVQA